MKNILIINTGDTNAPTIALKTDTNIFKKVLLQNPRSSEALLPAIDMLLKEHGLDISEITSIELFTGPGSYTGLRVGATIASTISLLLNIPINGLPPGQVPKIEYGKDLWSLGEH